MKKATNPKSESGAAATAILENPHQDHTQTIAEIQKINERLEASVIPEPALPSDPNATILETPLAETLPESPPPSPPLPPVMAAAAPAANPALRYFKKVQVQSPLYVDKVRIQFEVLDQGLGVIKLDPATHASTIEVLDGFFKARKGGVVAIDEPTYTSLKKNPRFLTSAQGSRLPKLRLWDSRPKQLSPSVGAGDAAIRSNLRPSVVGSSRGSASPVVGDAAGAGKSPVAFTPNLQRKSGVLKTPASGQFRADAGIPPQLP